MNNAYVTLNCHIGLGLTHPCSMECVCIVHYVLGPNVSMICGSEVLRKIICQVLKGFFPFDSELFSLFLSLSE